MPECYLCGAHIARGAGHRRKVQTGTSSRIYMTRRGGASYGTQYALRTLCSKCATAHDRFGEGRSARFFGYFVGWIVSAVVGWNIIMSGEGGVSVLTGLAFIFGLPVFILGGVYERGLESEIIDDVYNPPKANLPYAHEASSGRNDDARRADESPVEWLNRVLPEDIEDDTGIACFAVAQIAPPAVGERLETWILRWPVDKPLRIDDPAILAGPFREGETIAAWAHRSAGVVGRMFGKDRAHVEAWLKDLAKVAEPQHGEDIRAFINRAEEKANSLGLDMHRP